MSSCSPGESLHRSFRRQGWVFALTLISLTAGAQAPEVHFTAITAHSHIDFTQENSPTSNKYLIETMGGGVALLDYDNDGRLDIFFTNGALLSDPMPDGKLPDKTNKKFWNRLYHQNADGTFNDVTERAGLNGVAQGYYNMGVAVGDYDNDGFEDLYVTGFGGNILYHNNGDGTFTDVTEKAGVKGGSWSASAGFFDYDNDGKLDIFVTRYLDWTIKTNRYCGERPPNGVRSYCHPDNYDGVTNILYHNNGDGTFTDVSQKAGVANPHGKSLGVDFADYDGDGFTDIFVSNDSVQCFLYHNNGNRTFTEVGLLAGVGYNEDGKTFAGMGIDFNDYDNDGWPDIVVTDLSNERYMLFRNEGTGTFRDVTNLSGIGGATLTFSGWSTHFFDYDNDGWKDLFVAQSHVMDTIQVTSPNLRYMEPPLLLRNDKGHFARVIAGDVFQQDWAGRGAAFGDIDNDGDIDIVVSNLGQKAYILRNDGGNKNNWIGIQPVGTKSNRDGIGARIKVVSASGSTQYFTVNTATGYQSASDKRVIAGLGKDSTAKLIEIRWPSGIAQKFEDVKARQYLKAIEPTR
ncbi:MAG TPA: CRTAC1 family protein [Candidatus Sulfotelmatobacter sp.]|nr:CRTAC1 family protein [Candidatus Sulfotelmatobacter sp.]